MGDVITKEFKAIISFDRDLNSFHSLLTPPADGGPEFSWEVLKLAVVNMVKMAPYYSDPIVRQNVELAAKAMKTMILGTDSSIQQMRMNHQAMNKELQA